jgi:Zn-finger nucleic acid-binding protein
MELICPKCHGAMRAYERNGVTVDQCADCRGIFLDRGELERLVDAESAWYGTQREQPGRPSAPEPAYDDRGYGGGYDTRRKKKRSFLDDLFD